MAIICMIVSGILAGLSNLCMRYHLDKGGARFCYFVPYLFVTFLVTLWMHPIRSGSYSCDSCTLVLGLLSGMAMAGMKQALGKAIQRGPSGLIYATVNSSSVFPAILFVAFGSSLIPVDFTIWNIVGALLVVVGIFWATKGENLNEKMREWLTLAILASLCYLVFMVLIEVNDTLSGSEWFLPVTFGSSLVFYTLFSSDRTALKQTHWGLFAGILNGIYATLFLYSLKVASEGEISFIFPLSTVTIITVCNIWGRWLYKESVNWAANGLAMTGILISAF